jgi:hypothetical protein
VASNDPAEPAEPFSIADVRSHPYRIDERLPDARSLMPETSMVEDYLDVAFAARRPGGGDGFAVFL